MSFPVPRGGWFCEFDAEPGDGPEAMPWTPSLETGAGVVVNLSIRFASEVECEDWIREYVIGVRML
jgi:hypothetical protein